MRQKRFLAYLAIQAFVIISVILIFKLISEVKLASTVAGVLFVFLPIALGSYEWKKHGTLRKSFYLGLLQFWLFFALPILGLRIFNWEMEFRELAFLGVPGPVLHKYANTSYLIMMALTLSNYFRKE